MKVKVWIDDTNDNFTQRQELIDIERDFGLTATEWNNLSDFLKDREIRIWITDRINIKWEEINE